MPESLGPARSALNHPPGTATHSTFVVNSFMSQTTKLDPPLPHPTEPLFAPCSRFAPGGLPLPNIALSSSSIRYSFLMNSDGPDCPPPSPPPPPAALFDNPACRMLSDDLTEVRGMEVNPAPPFEEGSLPEFGRTDRSCDTKSSSLTAPLDAESGLADMLADEGWTDDQAAAFGRPPLD